MFNRSTSDCEYVKKHSIANDNFAELNFGTTCFENPRDSWESNPLTADNMMRALPLKYEHPEDKVTMTYIHVLKEALVSQNGDVFVGNHKIVGHRCPVNYNKDKHSTVYPTDEEQHKAEMYDEVFTLSQHRGTMYFHILVESLPRLPPFAQFLQDNPNIKIHIFGLNHSYLHEFFSHFNISEDRFVTGLIRAPVLYLPQSGPCFGALVFNSRMQSMIHRTKITASPQPRRSIVLIKRSKKRYFNHHDAILAALQEVAKEFGGYDVEVFSDDPLPTQAESMAMFNRAFMVVAPHGAGESNLLFSEPGTILVEGLCSPLILCFRNHMHGLGHRYYGIFLKDKTCFEYTTEDILKPVRKYLEIIDEFVR